MPASTGAGNSPLWSRKPQDKIYDDILTLFQRLVTQTGGHARQTDDLVMAMSPAVSVMLGKINELGTSVMDSVKRYFPRLRVVVAPEYATTGGELVQLFVPRIGQQDTLGLLPSEKMYSFAPLKIHSRVEQKFRAGTFGAVWFRPAAVASMLGV